MSDGHQRNVKRTVIADAILEFWLAGASEHPELARWWETQEAAECADEMALAIVVALEARP